MQATFLRCFPLRVWLEDIYGLDSGFSSREERWTANQEAALLGSFACPRPLASSAWVMVKHPLADVTVWVEVSFYSLAARAVWMLLFHMRGRCSDERSCQEPAESYSSRNCPCGRPAMDPMLRGYLSSLTHWFMAQRGISTYKKGECMWECF